MRTSFRKALSFIVNQTTENIPIIQLFGIVMAINYPLYFFVWSDQPFHDPLNVLLRLLATILCLLLIFIRPFHRKNPTLSSFFWLLAISYCLPFFFTFMTFHHHLSCSWLMNCVSAAFLGLIILDITLFFLVYLLGSFIGFFTFSYLATPQKIQALYTSPNVYEISWTFFAVIIIGSIFSYKRSQILQEKLSTAQSLGGMMAHELQTHLTGLFQNLMSLKRHTLPDIAEKLLTRMGFHTRRMDWIIENLFKTLQDVSSSSFTQDINIRELIQQALTEYPFQPGDENFIHLELTQDFWITTNCNLFKHMLFNLIKNALYAVKKKGSGAITLRTSINTKGNGLLEVHDTGCVIAKKHLSHLFEVFFTTNPKGVGLGLAFVKKVVQASQGSITCESQVGEYTTFHLTFSPLPASLKNETTQDKDFDSSAETLVTQKGTVYK